MTCRPELKNFCQVDFGGAEVERFLLVLQVSPTQQTLETHATPESSEMSQTPGSREYIERVRAAAIARGSLENTPDAPKPHATKPVASWFNGTCRKTDDLDVVFNLARDDAAISRKAVCVVEGISWDWIGAMGIFWAIEPRFFAEYGVNPQGDNAWRTLFPEDRRLGSTQGSSKYKHVDGVFEHQHLADRQTALDVLENGSRCSVYQRRCWNPNGSAYPPSSNTRISYCRVNANLYLFLVDPPPFPIAQDVLNFERITASMQNLRFKTRLRVQCPGSCGIDLPQLLRRKVYSLRQTLHSVFRHTWQIKIMFDDESVGDMAIKSGELLHLISASLHRTNFVTIDREIKAISFQELRNPDMRTNTKLLTLREVLSELATGTAETSKYAPSQVHTFYGSIYDRELHVLDELDFHSPIARLAILSQQADELQRFLMDSFQLLMSSISVKETQNAADQAKMSMEQAVRTAKLTQLAFVYIPLTFVTGVFGMNVRELSDPVPALWVCAVTLVVIAAATAAIFGSYKYKPVNLLSDLLKQRKTKTRGLRWTAVTSEGTGAMATDEEKGPTRSGLAPGC